MIETRPVEPKGITIRSIIYKWLDDKYSDLRHDLNGQMVDVGHVWSRDLRDRVIRYYDGDIIMHSEMIATIRDHRMDPHVELYCWDINGHEFNECQMPVKKVPIADPELFKKLSDHIRRWRKKKGYR